MSKNYVLQVRIDDEMKAAVFALAGKTDASPAKVARWGLCLVLRIPPDKVRGAVMNPDAQPPEVADLVAAAREALRVLDYQASQGSIEQQHNDALRAALAPFIEGAGDD